MFEEKKISVITPSYNSERFISETIKSVLMQSYKNWELIIVDDCSSDKTIEIIKEFANNEKRIKFFKNKANLGAAVTRNYAFTRVTGEYIAFLDSDDLWHPDKLKLQLEFMKKNNYNFSFTGYKQINENDLFIKNINNLPEKVNYENTIKSNKIGCLTVMIKVGFFKEISMPNLRKRQDFGLWLKLLKECDYAYCLPEILSSYRVRRDSVSSDKLSLIKFHWELYRNIEKQSVLKSLYYLSYHIFNKVFLRK
ncbi:glycosyltransferase family 2 protein [Aquimarina agarivorans]|uniref:glycosyltransferase family 2 protein n=1 Tax=Aquimarina agarivorans TaxID=980584 RepID=UPI000248EB35|nr:glycosyltransferase family 2 protein [Aquimarina agarivorans]